MSDLFRNAVQSIILGLEDYQAKDTERTLSAVRNYYAGLLLLAKEVLVRAVPDADESDILAANYKPKPDGSGGVKYVAQSERSIDLQEIGTRFKDFGLSIDMKVLRELSHIRNAVEHRSPDSVAGSMRQSIAKSFPLVYKLFREAKEDTYEVLEHTWQTMLDVHTIYDEELKTCRDTFNKVEWNNSILADASRLCVECGSELVAQNNRQNSDMQQIEATCRSCGVAIGAEKLIKYSIYKHMDGQLYTSVRYGGRAPLQDCPECSLLTYVVGSEDDGCVWCEYRLGDCIFCETKLTPDDVDSDDFRMCSYCGYKFHKDD